jgi:hypothetical protein
MRFVSPGLMRMQPGPLVGRLLACWRLPPSRATPRRCQTACRQPSPDEPSLGITSAMHQITAPLLHAPYAGLCGRRSRTQALAGSLAQCGRVSRCLQADCATHTWAPKAVWVSACPSLDDDAIRRRLRAHKAGALQHCAARLQEALPQPLDEVPAPWNRVTRFVSATLDLKPWSWRV